MKNDIKLIKKKRKKIISYVCYYWLKINPARTQIGEINDLGRYICQTGLNWSDWVITLKIGLVGILNLNIHNRCLKLVLKWIGIQTSDVGYQTGLMGEF